MKTNVSNRNTNPNQNINDCCYMNSVGFFFLLTMLRSLVRY